MSRERPGYGPDSLRSQDLRPNASVRADASRPDNLDDPRSKVVRAAGVEPALLSELDFESERLAMGDDEIADACREGSAFISAQSRAVPNGESKKAAKFRIVVLSIGHGQIVKESLEGMLIQIQDCF